MSATGATGASPLYHEAARGIGSVHEGERRLAVTAAADASPGARRKSPGARAKLPISVFVIARNEEARLRRTLDAIRWADQIVVVDSGSTDRTREIATEAGAEVHSRPFTGYGPQKAHGESLCRHDWLLNVDADEVVSEALADEIAGLFSHAAPEPAAYRLRILNVYPGDAAPRPWANDYNVVRLYHRAVARYRDHPSFDRVTAGAGCAVKQLSAPVHHHPLLSFEHFIAKENRYSSFRAKEASRRRRWLLMARLPFEAPLAFLKFYFLRRHVTGGWKGFVFAATAGYFRMARIAKMLEQGADPAHRSDTINSSDVDIR